MACHGQPPARRRHPESRARRAGAAPPWGLTAYQRSLRPQDSGQGLSWGGARGPGGDGAPGMQPGQALGGGAVAGVDRRASRQSPHRSLRSGPRRLRGHVWVPRLPKTASSS